MRLRTSHDPRPGQARRLTVLSAAGGAALVMAGVAACGSAAGPAAGGGVGGTPNGACAASDLKVTVNAGAAGAAAGSTYYPIDFTNASGVSCRLDGYPDAWFVTSAGRPIGAPAARDYGVTSRPVSLPPGATAHAWLQVTDAANYPAAACRPVTAHVLRIRAPGAAGASSVRRAFPACAAAIHGRGILTVQPVVAGPGSRGSA
jgi:hypothetical protein